MATYPIDHFSSNLSPEFPCYYISESGRLYSKKSRNGIGNGKNWIELSGAINNGYRRFLMRNKNGEKKHMFAHRLVAEAFIGAIPDDMEVCHNDGNPLNNNVKNLRIDTPKSNQADRAKHGTKTQGEDVNTSVLSKEDVIKAYELAAAGKMNTEIAVILGVQAPAINSIFKRRNWKHIEIPHELIKMAETQRTHRQKSTIQEEDILEIFKNYKNGMKVKEIASKFNAHKETIRSILKRKNWKNVEIPFSLLP